MGNDVLGYETATLPVYGSAGSLLSKTLTQLCDAVINLPVLKDHGIVGVTMALKNMFGAIHNPNKYHPNAGDPYVADVNMLPAIRQKVRLTICDAPHGAVRRRADLHAAVDLAVQRPAGGPGPGGARHAWAGRSSNRSAPRRA